MRLTQTCSANVHVHPPLKEEDILVTLYMKTFSSPGSSSIDAQANPVLLPTTIAVLTQPVSEGALDGYTEANHKIEILQQAQQTLATLAKVNSPPKYR